MSSKTNTNGGSIETPAEEEARLSQELADLQRPQKILKLKAQIEASRKGNPLDDEQARPCCLTILRAEENAHSGTRAQLDEKSLELDNLKVEYSNREKDLADLKLKLKQVEDELKIMTQARDQEQSAHNQTKAGLEAMTESRDQERTAHNKTNTSLKAVTSSRDEEQTAHNQTKSNLKAVTQSRDKEQEAHERTKATLQAVTEARDQERAAHVKTKATLQGVTETRDQEQNAHAQTKANLKAMTESRDLEQVAHDRTRADLKTMTASRDEEKAAHRRTKGQLDAVTEENESILEELARRTVPPPVRDIRFQEGYPKPAEGGWTLLNDSYKINHKGEVTTYNKKGGKMWTR
ncbi:uncharacterized protein Z520_00806 [Fonsecaea multimorphosa CBS 102226]|uniref:Uncharacterized protein n=1 Tax=Fonsecaea multimorphosa CBS 102226 TaxID=1442371 RepID=A0A0D2L4W4_9EURO|nr:uncharacterized protein Z520_00806 [Fonsecaea multimorphosa CBS 102226]KIY04114.1 hypothetical protein Z520_00806 [Fonsecaea multimorphosa CBS 102226]OAL31945.1 hypothetical protein AYO22_00815 [Fonsecaea multimorphosa]